MEVNITGLKFWAIGVRKEKNGAVITINDGIILTVYLPKASMRQRAIGLSNTSWGIGLHG